MWPDRLKKISKSESKKLKSRIKVLIKQLIIRSNLKEG